MSVLVTTVVLNSIPKSFAQGLQKSDPARDFQLPSEAAQAPAYYFKRETFEPYLNGTFKLSAGANSVEATLVSVRDCTPSAKSAKVTKKSRPSDSFAIIFRAQGKLTDLTSIYDVEHGALGKFALFLSYREGPGHTHFYEAVFNHAL
jgi:hypothetical protein